jgi:hypothetical protein
VALAKLKRRLGALFFAGSGGEVEFLKVWIETDA